MKKGSFLTLLKATRIERAFYIVSLILVPAAFANILNKEIIVLSICCLLLYSVSGIHNAKRDKDYTLPRYYKKFMIFLIIITLLLSLIHWLIFLTVLIEMGLGLIYNTISRKILFGDATILGFTHAGVPVFVSSLLVGLGISFAFKISVFMYIFIWLLGNARNQKDAKQDKKRKYKTYATKLSNHRPLTKLFTQLSFFIMLLALLLFDLSIKYIFILSFIYIIEIIILYLTDLKEDVLAMQITRFTIILFSLAFVIDKTTDLYIIFIDIILAGLFILFILPDIWNFKN